MLFAFVAMEEAEFWMGMGKEMMAQGSCAFGAIVVGGSEDAWFPSFDCFPRRRFGLTYLRVMSQPDYHIPGCVRLLLLRSWPSARPLCLQLVSQSQNPTNPRRLNFVSVACVAVRDIHHHIRDLGHEQLAISRAVQSIRSDTWFSSPS